MIGESREVRVRPQTMLDAQMSLPYSLAVAMLDGEAGIAQFAAERLRDPAVLALADRIHAYAHPDLESAKAGNLTSYLELSTRDGRCFRERLVSYRGHPDNPMSDEEMEAKFRRCARLLISEARVGAAGEAIWGLDKLAALGSHWCVPAKQSVSPPRFYGLVKGARAAHANVGDRRASRTLPAIAGYWRLARTPC